jgi:hypothetical protein
MKVVCIHFIVLGIQGFCPSQKNGDYTRGKINRGSTICNYFILFDIGYLDKNFCESL